MPAFVLQPAALAPEVFASVRERVLASPLIARSTLMGSFQASRGFAVTFKREALEEVGQRFEGIAPFLRLALEPRSGLPVQKLSRRLLPWREPNAFYLNVLVVPAGASVGRHSDVTLRGPSGDAKALPQQVTVLYVKVPEQMTGGRLRLYAQDRRVAEITPRENALVRFRGDLLHEVETVSAPGDSLRASLVLEQYCLSAQSLANLPPMHVRSNAGFSAYLNDERPKKEFVVE